MKSFSDYITEGDQEALQKKGAETKAEYLTAKDRTQIAVAQNPVDKKWYALGGLGFVSISKPMRDKATAKKFALSQRTGASLEPSNRSLQDKLKLRAQFGDIVSDDPKKVARAAHIRQKAKSRKRK